MKILKIELGKAEHTHGLSLKFGGQPDWLKEPQWPISKTTGEPMDFICQIEISKELFPFAKGKVAFVFFACDEKEPTEFYSPASGDNAVIIQPDGEDFPYAETQSLREGPSAGPEINCELESSDEPDDKPYSGDKIGGNPDWIQYEELDESHPEVNRLLVQMTLPNDFKLSGGQCYVLINENGTMGRFVYQR